MSEPLVIALAADTWLYAPLFVAHEAGFFGNVPIVFGVLERKTDAKTKVGGQSGNGEKKRLLENEMATIWKAFADSTRPPLITVCDPMHALLYNLYYADKRNRPELIGALLKRPACWVFDEKGSLRSIIRGLTDASLDGIVTHSPGMTADTLTRWVLLKRAGLPLARVDALVQHVDRPGAELDAFSGAGPLRHAAVSVDYFRMLDLLQRNPTALSICHDFSVDFGRYLMTGLLSTKATRKEYGAELETVLNGISLATAIFRRNPGFASALLRQHYLMRNHRLNDLGFPNCGYAKPLPPFQTELLEGELLEKTVKGLSQTRCYPESVWSVPLRMYLASTWQVYIEAHQAGVRDLLGPRRKLAGHIRALEIRDVQPTTARRASILHSVCHEFSRRLTRTLPHPETHRVVAWVRERQKVGVLKFRDLQVTGRFLVANDDRRRELKDYINVLKQKVRRQKDLGNPIGVGIFGPSGSGKDTFARNVLKELASEGLLRARFEISLTSQEFNSAEAAIRRLSEKLAKLRDHEIPIGVFVNECNKRGDSIFTYFLPYLQPDGTLPRQIPEKVIRSCVWFFAGTLPAEKNAIKAGLATGAGPDFMSRLEATGGVLGIPKTSEPVEQMVRFLAKAFTDIRGEVYKEAPTEIEPDLLIWLATCQLADPRTMDGIMMAAKISREGRVGDQVLRKVDVMTWDQIVEFRSTYREALRDLEDVNIKLEWMIG